MGAYKRAWGRQSEPHCRRFTWWCGFNRIYPKHQRSSQQRFYRQRFYGWQTVRENGWDRMVYRNQWYPL